MIKINDISMPEYIKLRQFSNDFTEVQQMTTKAYYLLEHKFGYCHEILEVFKQEYSLSDLVTIISDLTIQ